MHARSVEPLLAVPDIVATVRYYEQVLGFADTWTWGMPPTHGGARLGDAGVQFSLDPQLAEAAKGFTFMFFSNDVRSLYDGHRGRGANVLSPLENKPWNLAEYMLEDLNGYRLRIGGNPIQEQRSSPVPEGLQVEIRVPTPEEFVAIQPGPLTEAVRARLRTSHTGAVAFIEGRPVGMVRVMQDHEHWLSIWDVEVVEDLRGQHIGFTLMRVLLDRLAETHPGAFVHLYTFKHGFYEKLGFSTGTVTQLRLPGS